MKYVTLIAHAMMFFVLVNFWSPAQAQQLESFLSQLKLGQWIEFEGSHRDGFTILAGQVKVFDQELEDDDWEVNGAVTRVAPEEQTIYIVGLPIKLDDSTEYDDAQKAIQSFSDIKPGMIVKVRGQYTGEGVFLGFEVESSELKEDEKGLVKWIGKVEGAEPEGHSINILGHVLALTPETRISSLDRE